MTAAMLTEPSWCTDHLVDDDMVLHASSDRTVPATAGGAREQFTVAVAVEREDLEGNTGQTHVRLEVSRGPAGIPGGGPMTPAQALRLADVLRAAALDALGGAR